ARREYSTLPRSQPTAANGVGKPFGSAALLVPRSGGRVVLQQVSETCHGDIWDLTLATEVDGRDRATFGHEAPALRLSARSQMPASSYLAEADDAQPS